MHNEIQINDFDGGHYWKSAVKITQLDTIFNLEVDKAKCFLYV